MSTDAPLPSGAVSGPTTSVTDYPIRFDLRPDPGQTRRVFKSNQGPFAATYVGFGVALAVLGVLFSLGYFGGNITLGMVFAVGGVAFALGMVFAARRATGNEAVALTITGAGLEFARRSAPPVPIEWNDPSLKLNLSEFQGNPEHVFPFSDARRARPQWVDVFLPPAPHVKLRTPVPEPAASTLVREAEQRGLVVNVVRVAFWWHSAPKSPGWLDYDVEGRLGPKRTLNGRIVEFRGRAWKDVPEGR